MKKHFLGLFALVIALGLSAFSHSAGKATASEEALYWYPVTQSTNAIDHSALINSSAKLTKSQLRDNSQIPCPETPGVDCIRGFRTLQTADVTTAGIDFTQTDMQ